MKKYVITLKYGKEESPLRMPYKNLLGVIVPEKVPVSHNPGELIESSLDSPTSGLPFDKIFQRGDRVTLVVSDITRYTGSRVFLPILIKRLNRIGVPNEKIRIVFALGIHRQQLPQEHKTIVGDKVYKEIRVHDHDAFDSKNLVSPGVTDTGTKFKINRYVAEADKIILTGAIGFHYLAGFGGGRKSILPGVASFDNCMDAHLKVLNPPEIGGRHPKAKTGIMEGNPFHEIMLEACELLPPLFLVNTILSTTKEIIHVVTGDHLDAHQYGCSLLLDNFSPQIEERADLVIVSCGGFPKDINFIQAHKSIDYAMDCVKDNGVMIVLAECPDGLGNPTFIDWFEYDNVRDLETALRQRFEINGQTAYAVMIKAKKVKIILVSRLARDNVEKMSMIPAESLDQGLFIAHEMLGGQPSTYVIPDGGSVFPRFRGAKGQT